MRDELDFGRVQNFKSVTQSNFNLVRYNKINPTQWPKPTYTNLIGLDWIDRMLDVIYLHTFSLASLSTQLTLL